MSGGERRAKGALLAHGPIEPHASIQLGAGNRDGTWIYEGMGILHRRNGIDVERAN
jgi:hypothetical protein